MTLSNLHTFKSRALQARQNEIEMYFSDEGETSWIRNLIGNDKSLFKIEYLHYGRHTFQNVIFASILLAFFAFTRPFIILAK